MTNPLSLFLTRENIISAYRRISGQLLLDNMIFDSMNQVAQRNNFVIDLLNSNASNAEKHEEVIRQLTNFSDLLQREGLFFDLIEDLHSRLQTYDNGVHASRLRDIACIKTSEIFDLRLNENGSWRVDWTLDTKDQNEPAHIYTTSYLTGWGNIVPPHIIQYINSSLLLYKQKQYAATLALMTIAAEATLHDFLVTKGYVFDVHANKFDIYHLTQANLDTTGAGYVINLVDQTPKTPSDLVASANNALPVNIRIRREINPSNGRVDLAILAPSFLIDHLSRADVENPAKNSVSGLGDALRIARQIQDGITTSELPIYIDDILRAVRNKLVHLSSESLDYDLPRFNGRKGIAQYKLKDFVDDPVLVFNFVQGIPDFVERIYVRLWKAGTHI